MWSHLCICVSHGDVLCVSILSACYDGLILSFTMCVCVCVTFSGVYFLQYFKCLVTDVNICAIHMQSVFTHFIYMIFSSMFRLFPFFLNSYDFHSISCTPTSVLYLICDSNILSCHYYEYS
jgi:hypothetical protein